RYCVGVDLGQSRDPTAIAVVRRVDPPGPVPEDDFGLKPKPNYAPGSVEWQEEQRRRENEAAVDDQSSRDRAYKAKRSARSPWCAPGACGCSTSARGVVVRDDVRQGGRLRRGLRLGSALGAIEPWRAVSGTLTDAAKRPLAAVNGIARSGPADTARRRIWV